MPSPTMVCWLAAGLCLLCCMGGLRCSDASRIRHAGVVGRFYEGALGRTKTARSKERATVFIPMVVPTFGLLGKPWLIEFLKARHEAGLVPVPTLCSRAHDWGS
jgi:hypothetical protein